MFDKARSLNRKVHPKETGITIRNALAQMEESDLEALTSRTEVSPEDLEQREYRRIMAMPTLQELLTARQRAIAKGTHDLTNDPLRRYVR